MTLINNASNSDATGSAHNNGNNSNITTITLPAKFKLLEFDHACPEIRFAASDVIFANNGITDNKAKFSELLQHLDTDRLKNIQSVITNKNEKEPYSRSKAILLGLYAQSDEQKFEQLLGSGLTKQQMKPSLLLDEIRRLGTGVILNENVIKKLWSQRLPTDIQAHIASDEHLKIGMDKLVRTADLLYTILHPTMNIVVSVDTRPQAQMLANESHLLSTLANAIATLTSEVSAIKSQMYDRSRSRGRLQDCQHNNRSRSGTPFCRSNTPFRQSNTPFCQLYFVKDQLCTYHFRFGDNARKCIQGCKHYKDSS